MNVGMMKTSSLSRIDAGGIAAYVPGSTDARRSRGPLDCADDVGHAAAAKHKIKKRAGTTTETISIPVGLCIASSRVLWCLTADRSIDRP
jgi:hypothetical protein